MRLLFIALLSVIFLPTVIAQPTAEFEWAELQNRKVNGKINPVLVFPMDSGFTMYSIEEIGKHFYAPKIIYISKFDDSCNFVSAIDFKLPERSRNYATLLKVIEGDNKLYFFSYLADKKDGKNILYAQVYDNLAHEISEAKELYTIPIEKVNNSGFFDMSISANKEHLSLLVNLPFEKKTNEAISVLQFDANLNRISESSHNLSFESERAYQETFFAQDDGSSVIIKKTDITKKDPITTAILINGNEIREHQVSSEDFYISDHRVISIDGHIYIIGFATDNAKPGISVGGAKDKSYFMYDLSENKLVKNQEWSRETIKNVLGGGYLDLKVKDIIIENDDIYLIGDCYSVRSEAIEGKNFEYNYTHRFGPGVAVKLNLNGDVIYETPIQYGEEFMNEMNVLGSFLPFVKNGKLYVLANEKESILKDKKIVMGYDKINANAVVLKSIDDEGNISLTPFWNSKTGGAKEYTKMAPAKSIMLSNNTFYVYAIGNDMSKLGKLTILD